MVASVFFALATFRLYVVDGIESDQIGVRSCEIESGRVARGDMDSRRHFALWSTSRGKYDGNSIGSRCVDRSGRVTHNKSRLTGDAAIIRDGSTAATSLGCPMQLWSGADFADSTAVKFKRFAAQDCGRRIRSSATSAQPFLRKLRSSRLTRSEQDRIINSRAWRPATRINGGELIAGGQS